MNARISTRLACTETQLWQKIMDPESLRFVSSPILTFVPADSDGFDDVWQVDRVYQLRLYFLSFIPLGRHSIQLVKIDQDSHTILSEERGLLVPVWNHRIHFQEVAPDVVNYTDEIEIKAGCLTLLIWLFAHIFYRHRQRRWKTLIQIDISGQQDNSKP